MEAGLRAYAFEVGSGIQQVFQQDYILLILMGLLIVANHGSGNKHNFAGVFCRGGSGRCNARNHECGSHNGEDESRLETEERHAITPNGRCA